MLLGALSQLLPLDRVICRLDISGGFACEHILNGEDLVKELKLLLCRFLISLAHLLALVLNKSKKHAPTHD